MAVLVWKNCDLDAAGAAIKSLLQTARDEFENTVAVDQPATVQQLVSRRGERLSVLVEGFLIESRLANTIAAPSKTLRVRSTALWSLERAMQGAVRNVLMVQPHRRRY